MDAHGADRGWWSTMRADPLLHPVTLISMALLGLNDHWWKASYPGWFTGKLSDVAGLVFFPVLLEALGLARRWSVALTFLGFTAVKAWPWANAVWNDAFTALYQTLGWHREARLLADTSDLLALPAIFVILFLPVARRRRPVDAEDPRDHTDGHEEH